MQTLLDLKAGQPKGSAPVRSSQGTALKVAVAGKLTALAAPGGGEIQWRKTTEALRAEGMNIRFWRPWEDGFEGIDCLHLFGSEPEHLPVVEAARARKIPVVLSHRLEVYLILEEFLPILSSAGNIIIDLW